MFDKTAYQKEYMRKYRSKQYNGKNPTTLLKLFQMENW